MKRLLLLATLLSASLRLLAAPDAIATPATLSYQGKIANSSGTLIGAGTPVNQALTFRIWTSPTSTDGADRLWSEKITTTVSEGEFSVMLGSGETVSSETNQRNSFAEVFAGQSVVTTTPGSSDRYLGITIGTGTDEIFPRQKIVTTAFAFRAKVAESVAATSVTGAMIANGAVTSTQLATDAVQTTQIKDANVTNAKLATDAVQTTQIKDANVTNAKLAGQDAATPGDAQVVVGAVSTAKLQNGAVTTAKIADLQVTTAKLANNAVTTAKIADGQITSAKLASDVSGFWSVASTSVYRASGKVGIGVTAPAAGSDLPTATALLQIRDRPVDLASFNTTPTAWIGTATSNGGNTLAAPETALVLARPGINAQSYPNLVRFDVSRYELPGTQDSRTKLDIRLSHGDLNTEGNNTPTIMSLKSDGSVGVAGKITSPMWKVTEVIPYSVPYDGSVADNPSISRDYVASGGTWLVTATATGYNPLNGYVFATLKIKGVEAGKVQVYGGGNTHLVMTRQFIVTGKPAGTYSITWGIDRRMDSGDYWQVVIMELPF